MMLHHGPNPWESVEVVVANLTQDFKENRVLDTTNLIPVRVNPGKLMPQCLATIKDCQDPQKFKPGEAPPVLTFKWWGVEDLACKRLDVAFGVDFQLVGLLDLISQHEAVRECNGLGDKNYTAQLMAGSHHAKASVRDVKGHQARDDIGGVTCAITLMSALKQLTHVKAKYLSSNLPEWKAFTSSEIMGDFLEELLEVLSPEVLRTNLSHLVTQDLLDSINCLVKEHQPKLTMGKGMTGPNTPP
ncbi:hypothetical protein FRC10_000912 [Ceratobasidium sp. 414]|nr:hypothetical protein FRC10_000912 [Ceratobasidium sp. 414]